SSRRRHTRSTRDWSSDVCSSDLSTRLRGGRETYWKYPATSRTKCTEPDVIPQNTERSPAAPSRTIVCAARVCPAAKLTTLVVGQIGRASCRASVDHAEGAAAVEK